MNQPFDPDDGRLDPESLAKRLADQLRSRAPSKSKRVRFPTAGVLRGLGFAAIVIGIGFGATAALPWVAGIFGSTPVVEDPSPSFSGQAPVTVTTEPAPSVSPILVPETVPNPTTTTTGLRPRVPLFPPTPTAPTTTTLPIVTSSSAASTVPSTAPPVPPTTGPTTTTSTTTTTTTTTTTITTTTTTATTQPPPPDPDPPED